MIPMSDCSTNAMKRKLGYVLRWEINDPNDNMSQTTEVEVNDYRFISEQRYQQLEQVALRMFQKLDAKTTYKDNELDGIEEKLERLGVFDG